MDVQLKELLEKIKSEGIQSAEEEAAEITKKAKLEAQEIRERAEKDAQTRIEKAKSDIAKMEQTSKDALVQAGRDLLLNVKQRLEQMFNQVLVHEAGNILAGDVLQEIIVTAVKSWKESNLEEIDILVSPEDYKKLETALKKELAQELKKGVEIRPVKTISKGFKISEKDGAAYYNFTAQGIADILSEGVTPLLTETLKKAASGD